MKSYKQYRKEAFKIIYMASKHKQKKLYTDELVTDVITALALADKSYDKNRGLSLYQWRRYRAICAIKTHIRNHRKNRLVGLPHEDITDHRSDYDNKVGHKVDFLIRNAGLTTMQRQFIENYLQYNGIAEACKQSGITYKEGSSLWNAAMAKFKRVAVYAK